MRSGKHEFCETPRKEAHYQLNSGLGEPQSQSLCFGEGMNFLYPLGFELQILY
jgi:hypothetical protein